MRRRLSSFAVPVALCLAASAQAEVKVFGDKDLLGFGQYSSDPPEWGARTEGLKPGEVKTGIFKTFHNFPFTPTPEDFPGTDQVYVGSNQSASLDEYANYGGRQKGPQTFKLDIGDLLSGGKPQTLTLGIMFDDLQQPTHGQPFVVTVNGQRLDAMNQAINQQNLRDKENRPSTVFISAGLDPSILQSGNTLEVVIDQEGQGGDGWAVDYLTVGVTK